MNFDGHFLLSTCNRTSSSPFCCGFVLFYPVCGVLLQGSCSSDSSHVIMIFSIVHYKAWKQSSIAGVASQPLGFTGCRMQYIQCELMREAGLYCE